MKSKKRYGELEDAYAPKQREEKPYQFGILEYVKQAKPGTVEIDEPFIRSFYLLTLEEQGQVIEALYPHQRNILTARGSDSNSLLGETIQYRRLESFLQQWMRGMTEEWVIHMMVRYQTRVPLQIREEAESE